jgi:DNA-binding NarL/FixJ family response regulator
MSGLQRRCPRCGQPVATQLTPRQRELLLGIAGGETVHTMATRLCIARQTADAHVAAIRRALGVRSTAAMIAMAWREGWMAPQPGAPTLEEEP